MLLAIGIFLYCKNLYLSLVVVRLVIFLVPPSKGGWGRNSKIKFCQNFCFWCLWKVKKSQISVCMRLVAIPISAKGGFKDPPPPVGGRVKSVWPEGNLENRHFLNRFFYSFLFSFTTHANLCLFLDYLSLIPWLRLSFLNTISGQLVVILKPNLLNSSFAFSTVWV